MKLIKKYWKKTILILLSTAGYFIISIETDIFKDLPFLAQSLLFLTFFFLNLVGTVGIDEFEYGKLFQKLKTEKETLGTLLRISEKEISDLHRVITKFFNYSIIYRKDIIEKLELKEEFLCIMKSSEGFGKVWDNLEDKKMLPFTKILDGLPGSVRPFEKDGLFLIPIENLKGFNHKDIRLFINKRIIPKVKKERIQFLKALTKEQKKLVDKFSYKYIAFILRKNSLDYDTENRKFSDKFVQFIVSNQRERTLAQITNELAEFVEGKEVLNLIDWEAFIDDLNDDQKKLLNNYGDSIRSKFKQGKIRNIIDISNSDINKISSIIQSVLKNDTTERKSKNLSEKIVKGASETIRILRSAGAKL